MKSRELATLTSYPEGQTSLIDGIHAFSLKGASIKGKLQSLRGEFLDELKKDDVSKSTASDQQTVVVSYDPLAFPTPKEIYPTLHTHAAADDREKSREWRFNTKHRDITSEVTCFANSYGNAISDGNAIVPSFPITLTTGCAPNFMGTSAKDQDHFLKKLQWDSKKKRWFNGELKDPDYYEATMKLLFKRWLLTQDDSGVDALIVPLMGGGAYLSILSPQAKAEALERIHRALFAAIAETPFQHISEIIYALPDENKPEESPVRSQNYQQASGILKQYAQRMEMGPVVTIANVDALDAAGGIVTRKKKKVGVINAGSDRTIGGYYAEVAKSGVRGDKPPTFEEIIFNLTNASLVQTLEFNPHLSEAEFLQYSANLRMDTLSHDAQQEAPSKASTSTRKGEEGEEGEEDEKSDTTELKRPDFKRKESDTGVFVPFRINFTTSSASLVKEDAISGLEQAKQLLAQVAFLHKNYPQKKIGITYSANHSQTIKIRETYQTQLDWHTTTRGGNQALVLQIVEGIFAGKADEHLAKQLNPAEQREIKKLAAEYQSLRNVFRILPITTSKKAGGKGATTNKWINEDLTHIEEFARTNVVIGWQNQLSKADFAVGGGYAKLTDNHHAEVQKSLHKLQEVYPCAPGDKVTQYVGKGRHSHSTTTIQRGLTPDKNKKPVAQPPSKPKSPALSQKEAETIAIELLRTFKIMDELLKKIGTTLDKLNEEKKQANPEKEQEVRRGSYGRGMIGSID